MHSFARVVVAAGRLRSPVLALGFSVLLSASCGDGGAPDPVETGRGALTGDGVVDDADTPEGNVVVQLESIHQKGR